MEEKNSKAKNRPVTQEEKTVRFLKKHDLTVTAVESCTGGAVAAAIVNVPGASDVLSESYVTYSDKAKHRLVRVKKSTLKTVGAVSRACAGQMAQGGAQRSGADVCVSVTGLAGPDGGTKEIPVGTVFIGCCFRERVTVKEFHFEGDRSAVRAQAALEALKLIRKWSSRCLKED